MSLIIFNPGDKIKSSEVNDNFNEVLYSILYNRMENDTAGNTQLNTTIQSDVFSSCTGCYCTVCTTDTTSNFDTCYYTNKTESNYTYDTYPSTCCIYTSCCGLACICYDNNYTCAKSCARIACHSSASACVRLIRCGGDLCLADYLNVKATICHNWDFQRSTSNCGYICGLTEICFNDYYCCKVGVNDCGSASGDPYVPYNICNTVEYNKVADNCYEYFYNGISQCCIPATNIIDYILCSCVRSFSYVSGETFISCALSKVDIVTTNIINTTINTNLKDYSVIKESAILVTNSIMPNGNCITYDIKNQNGCIYLCNAEPNKIYNLCASDSCCFYAIIKQNTINCNNNEQCMLNYALKFL